MDGSQSLVTKATEEESRTFSCDGVRGWTPPSEKRIKSADRVELKLYCRRHRMGNAGRALKPLEISRWRSSRVLLPFPGIAEADIQPL